MAEGIINTNHDYSGTNVAKANGRSGTIDSNNCNRIGNLVICSGRIHTMDNETASGTFFLIPEGYRPYAQLRSNGFMDVNNVGMVPVMATINTNGTVEIRYSSSYTCTQVGFTATYSI